MSFNLTWRNLLDRIDEKPGNATFETVLTDEKFRIDEINDRYIFIKYLEGGEDQRLEKHQFRQLHDHIQEENEGFSLGNLPPNAEPHPTVLSLHPRYEVDERKSIISEKPVDEVKEREKQAEHGFESSEPTDIDVYTDSVLLIDALRRYDIQNPETVDTDSLIDVYTLLSDVQRNANSYRKEIADALLDRIHHDKPIHAQYGSVQRIESRRRKIGDEDEIKSKIKNQGIEPERVMGIERDKLDEALEVTELSEDDVYDISHSEYIRKSQVDEDVKKSRLQGLKDKLDDRNDEEVKELRQEIEELEKRINELTSFEKGTEIQG